MNNVLRNYLLEEINENKLSHAFLVETNNCDELVNDIYVLLVNNRIVLDTNIDNNLTVMVIRPDNNLIEKDKILDLQKFIMTKSVINKYKVYFIINAEMMNTSSFNKLLKVLEEPSENTIAFLLTSNESAILETIKSRCKFFKSYYTLVETNEDLGDVLDKLKKIRELSFDEILKLKKELLCMDKNNIINILDLLKKELLESIYNDGNSVLAMNYKILDNIIELINGNVNIELCIDKLIIEMRK